MINPSDFSIEIRDYKFYLLFQGAVIGHARRNTRGHWWWSTRLPGRRSGRKGFNSVVDCIASGSGLNKIRVQDMIDAVSAVDAAKSFISTK